MTQNSGFLFGYTNIIANGAIVLVTIFNIVVYKFRQQQEAEVMEKKNYRLSLSIRQLCYCFSFYEMKQATSNFHDTLVIGKGGFGNVYRGTLEVRDKPTVVAIKRLKSMLNQGSREFRAEIEMLTKVRHSHLVSLIGYCDEGYERILVYEFMPGGTLADHLYKRVRQGDTSLTPLSWIQRLKICIGAARGLDYLHTGTGIQHRIVHRDVKTTNILLDENFAAKISDFGIAKISPANQGNTYVSTHVKGTFGYFDPYYFQTRRLTRKSDVYAFGVVLFEVLCGRPALDRSLEEEQMSLAGWAQHCFREERLGEIIDPVIKGSVFSDSLDTFVKLAIQCLHTEPKHRPTMAEVVVGLESALVLQEKSTEYYVPEIISGDDDQEEIDISDFEVETENYETGKDDIANIRHQEKQPSAMKRFVAFLSVTAQTISASREAKTARNNGVRTAILKSSQLKSYKFKDLSVATRNFCADGMLSHRVFKGWVDEKWGTGTAIAVKKYQDGLSESDNRFLLAELQAEINYAGKLCHPNIVKLIGYCFEKKHQLLVYEYMPQGSLNTHLFRRGSDFQPLSWKLRISIALGAAKGLAYLHSPGTNVIHRDVKTSNILIDSGYNAKLSDFGFAKFGPDDDHTHVSTGIAGTIGYIAPEYALRGYLTKKTDIYSFGVVLLEILTGRSVYERNLLETGHGPFSWAKPYLTSENGILYVMDADIKGQYTVRAALGASSLALKCISEDSKSRPDANQVVKELEQLQDLENSENIRSETLQRFL